MYGKWQDFKVQMFSSSAIVVVKEAVGSSFYIIQGNSDSEICCELLARKMTGQIFYFSFRKRLFPQKVIRIGKELSFSYLKDGEYLLCTGNKLPSDLAII
jgi:hypothetical protein